LFANLTDVLFSDSSVKLTNVDDLMASKYEEELDHLLSSSKPLETSNVADCLSGTGLGFYIPDVMGSVLSTCYCIHCIVYSKRLNLPDMQHLM